jgi:branched-chain amino acid transport system substrate-binding protein
LKFDKNRKGGLFMGKKAKRQMLVTMTITIVCIAVMLILPNLHNTPSAEEKPPVVIGCATWTEGPALRDGRAYSRAFETAIDFINGRGGILGGRKVKGVITSQGMTGEMAKEASLKLVLKDKVKLLVGPHWSDMAPSGLAVAEKYNVPFAPEQGGMWLYRQKYPGTLGLVWHARARTMPQIRWVEKRGYKTGVCIFPDIDYNHEVSEVIKARWEKPGSPVKVEFLWYMFGQTELKKELTKALGYKPEFIWSEDWSVPVAISMLKTLKELGYKGVVLECSLLEKPLVAENKDVFEGVYARMDYWYDPEVPENKAFCEFWEKKWGKDQYPYRCEEAVYCMTAYILLSMDKAGTEGDGTRATLMKIHDAMHSHIPWNSTRGEPVRLTEDGVGIWSKVPLVQVRNGEIKILEYAPMVEDDWALKLGQ